MSEYGYFLSSEELSPRAMIEAARIGEEMGFDSVLVSDHFHPWLDAQGESSFVWSVLGAIAASTSQRLMTGVTCPTFRVHPAVLAQAAATMQLIADGRFRFGVGSGENLNEHILGTRWPPPPIRLEMLEEALKIIRRLFEGGLVNYRGRYYTVENARLYSLPTSPRRSSCRRSGRNRRIFPAHRGRLREHVAGGTPSRALPRGGREGTHGSGGQICWATDEGTARKLAFDRWKSSGLAGSLNQELALPSHFEAASTLVTEEQVADKSRADRTRPCTRAPSHGTWKPDSTRSSSPRWGMTREASSSSGRRS